MVDPILCRECPHSIEHHDPYGCQMCKIDPVTSWAPLCRESSSSIARAYADERVRDALRPSLTEEEQKTMTERRLQLVDLIAATRTDIPRLVAALQAVLDAHTPQWGECPWCVDGSGQGFKHPCPTIKAIAKAMEVNSA